MTIFISWYIPLLIVWNLVNRSRKCLVVPPRFVHWVVAREDLGSAKFESRAISYGPQLPPSQRLSAPSEPTRSLGSFKSSGQYILQNNLEAVVPRQGFPCFF